MPDAVKPIADAAMSLARAQEEASQIKARISELEEEIEAARVRLADLDAFIRLAKEFGGAVKNGVSQEHRARRAHTSSQGSRADTARTLAIQYVRSAGRPVTTRELVEELGKHGLVFGGGDPKKDTADLSAMLSRAPELTVQRGIGWTISGGTVHTAINLQESENQESIQDTLLD